MARGETSLLDSAIAFATQQHAGTVRTGGTLPYIAHPLEAMTIVASVTSDQEMLAAAALHDTVEDTDATLEDIDRLFGPRVAHLVDVETQVPLEGTEENTWRGRRKIQVERIREADFDSQLVALGDKLSNLRAIARDYQRHGAALWDRFHAGPEDYAWYYQALAGAMEKLAGIEPYEEYRALCDQVFPAK